MELSIEELSQAIKVINKEKAPGLDLIPLKILNDLNSTGKTNLLRYINEIINKKKNPELLYAVRTIYLDKYKSGCPKEKEVRVIKILGIIPKFIRGKYST